MNSQHLLLLQWCHPKSQEAWTCSGCGVGKHGRRCARRNTGICIKFVLLTGTLSARWICQCRISDIPLLARLSSVWQGLTHTVVVVGLTGACVVYSKCSRYANCCSVIVLVMFTPPALLLPTTVLLQYNSWQHLPWWGTGQHLPSAFVSWINWTNLLLAMLQTFFLFYIFFNNLHYFCISWEVSWLCSLSFHF